MYVRITEQFIRDCRKEMGNTKGGEIMIFALAVLLEEQFTLHQIGELLYGKN